MGRDQELQPEPGEGIAPGSTAALAFYADDGQGGIVMSGCIWTPPDCKRVWQALVPRSQLLTYIRLPYAA
jgi:hypothetical protein